MMNDRWTVMLNDLNRTALAQRRALTLVEDLDDRRRGLLNSLVAERNALADGPQRDALNRMIDWARRGNLTIEPFRADVDRMNAFFDLLS